MVELLLGLPNIDPNQKNEDGYTPFDLAAEQEKLDAADLLLERTTIDLQRVYKNGNTILHIAASRRNQKMVELLLGIPNIDPNQKNENGDTFIHSAVYGRSIRIVELLLDRIEIDPTDTHRNQKGNTPIHEAVRWDLQEIVTLLLEKSQIDPTDKYQKSFCENQNRWYGYFEDGDTLLHVAGRNGNLELAKLLLERTNIDPNEKNQNGDTLLHVAAEKNNLELVKLLLERTNIDPNEKNQNGDTLLHVAGRNGNLELVKLLLERTNIDPNEKNQNDDTILHMAGRNGNLELVQFLLERTPIDPAVKCQFQNGETLLLKAGRKGNIELVKLLLERTNLDPAKEIQNGETLLQVAGRKGNLELVKFLLERTNVDPTEKYQNGDTLLHVAGREGNLELVKFLLERTNIDPNEKNQQNEKPCDVLDYWNQSTTGPIKRLIQSYTKEERNVSKYTPTVTQYEDTPQDTLEKDRENQDLLPFAGTSEDFHILISTGTYESFENRVFLCGSCACGKSTLASVLIGSPIPLTWKSTDGLVIHFGRNGINLETYEMVPLKEEDRGHNVMTKLIIGKPNREILTRPSADTKNELCIAPSSTHHQESSIQVKQRNTSFSSKASVSPEAYIKQDKYLQNENTTPSEVKKVRSISRPQLKKVESYAVHDDILKEIKSGQYKIKIAPSDLVDFGGQRSYDMTHQLFIQHGGTFVVMFDGSRDFQEPLTEYPTGDISNESIVKHWVNSILTYCVDDDDFMPKILFAATHSDILSDDMQKKMKMQFVKKITEIFGSHEMKKHIIFEPVFFINGTDKYDHEIQNLTNQLVTIARAQPSWGLRRPMLWVPLELLIANMIKDNVHIIPKTQLVEANTMNKDLALSERQLEDFLLTQHSLGKIMYFNQPALNGFIILYPPALVNILRSFITDEIFWPKNETLKGILRRMRKTGKLYKRDLLKLWEQEQFVHHIQDDDFKEFIIQVLVHLDVLVIPKQYSNKSDAYVDYFLVPCTVKHKMPMSFLDDKSFAKRTIALVYQIQKSSIPSALSFKLVGAVSGIWPIKEVDGQPLLYHSSAVLCVDSNTEFRIMVEETRVVVYLTNMSSSSYISPDIAASIQECLTVTLQAVLKFYLISIGKNHQKVNLTNLFNIEVGEVCDRSPCVVSISKMKQTADWVCEFGNKHSSRRPLLWVFNKKQEECPSDCQGLAKDALTMSPSEQHLSRLANQLDINSCRELMIHLGLQLNDWNDIDYSYTRMPLVIKIMALNFWRTKTIRGKPTKSFNDLLDALKAVGDERHLLCKVFREHLLDIAEIRLQEVPHDDVLKDLPRNLGNCAIQLGIELGVSISSIEETLTRHPRDMYNQIEDILRKWKTSRGVKPTIYRLMLALERVHTGGLEYLKGFYIGQ